MSSSTIGLLLIVALTSSIATAFQIPHAGHHHPLYTRYRQEQLDQQGSSSSSPAACASDPLLVRTQGSAMAISEEEYGMIDSMHPSYDDKAPARPFSSNSMVPEVTISTPIDYDDETGMVQTAVRAIVQSPWRGVMDNTMVGLSSTLVIATGALHEVMHCVELEWTHNAAAGGTTEELAILSLGHFLHYGRETIRQLVEMHDDEDDDTTSSSFEQPEEFLS